MTSIKLEDIFKCDVMLLYLLCWGILECTQNVKKSMKWKWNEQTDPPPPVIKILKKFFLRAIACPKSHRQHFAEDSGLFLKTDARLNHVM